MTDTHSVSNRHTGKTIDLSPEARGLLPLPIRAHGYELLDANGALIGTIDYYGDNHQDAELTAFIAALVNEALTPAALPAVTVIHEDNAGLRQLITTEYEAHLCGDANCGHYALTGSPFCALHQVDAQGVTLAERMARR